MKKVFLIVVPYAIAHVALFIVMTLVVIAIVLMKHKMFGWCCFNTRFSTGEVELLVTSVVVVVPLSTLLTRRGNKSQLSMASVLLEHFRQLWLLYPIALFCLVVSISAINKLDSGEPGRAFLIMTTLVSIVSIIANLSTLVWNYVISEQH